MKVSHLHLGFTNLANAVQWMQQVLQADPFYQNDRMAAFAFENIEYVFDLSDSEIETTMAFACDDCEKKFQELVAKGAIVIEVPAEQPWGVKTAYLQGPGKVIIELEEKV